MKIAVISFTGKGLRLSERIQTVLPEHKVKRYCHISHCADGCEEFSRTGELVGELWDKADAIVFVSACGIAVRAAAPYLRSKTTDPAVVVMDDSGRYAIPILSGHIGGGNELAERLAERVGAEAVITTATDSGKHFSPDSFAAANGLMITDMSAAKAIASAILDGEKTGIVSDYGYTELPVDVSEDAFCRTGMYIGCSGREPFPLTLKLIPKNIVIGIGCRKETPAERIETAVKQAFSRAGIQPERIIMAATIDIKAREEGLLEYCRSIGVPLRICSAEELLAVPGEFTSSDFVRSVTGVDNVCERSAALCSGGKIVIRKTAVCGVTVAAAEKPITLDFERRRL